MSYRRTWSHTFETYELRIYDCGLQGCPEDCVAHEPYCIKAASPFATRKVGHISLIDPLTIPIIMPGIKQKLLEVSIESLLDNGVSWGYIIFDNSLRLIADSAEIFKRSIVHSGSDWKLNKWALDEDLSTVQLLDIDMHMDLDAGVGYATLHNAKLKLSGEYYTDDPPETATVRLTVLNSKTGALVKNAYIALMSGARIVADGYTDGGEIIFENIDEGSYTVKVLASGYYAFEQSIEVEPPMVWYEIKIVPIPTAPIPWWTWYAVGGVMALGAITVIPKVIGKKEKPIIVVR